MKRKSIRVVRQLLNRVNRLSDPIFNHLASDPRKGIHQALKQRKRWILRRIHLTKAFHHRERYEDQLHLKGVNLIAGVDEVGRGPLAGPVVTCAVILPRDFNLIRVNDSKQLTPTERERLYPKILDEALDYTIGIGSNHLIDKINIYQADLVAMKRAVSMLNPQPNYLIVDAMHINTSIPQLKLYHGDAKSVSVGAASIIAKVYRDHLMNKYGRLYPEYDFNHNAGYGTHEHMNALKKYGVTPIHRRTFNPIPKFLH